MSKVRTLDCIMQRTEGPVGGSRWKCACPSNVLMSWGPNTPCADAFGFELIVFRNYMMHKCLFMWRCMLYVSHDNVSLSTVDTHQLQSLDSAFVWRLLPNIFNYFSGFYPRGSVRKIFSAFWGRRWMRGGCRADAGCRREAEWVVRHRLHTETHA